MKNSEAEVFLAAKEFIEQIVNSQPTEEKKLEARLEIDAILSALIECKKNRN